MRSNKMKRVLCGLLSAVLLLPMGLEVLATAGEGNAPAETTVEQSDPPEQSQEPEEPISDDEGEAEGLVFNLPSEARAVRIIPGVDFYKDTEQDAESIRAELDAIMERASGYSLNTVLVDTVNDGVGYYDTDVNDTVRTDILKLAIESARAAGMHILFTFDIDHAADSAPQSYDFGQRTDYLITEAHRFAIKYAVDGILLQSYYADRNVSEYDAYRRNGSGIGYENWLLENNAYVFSTLSNVIHQSSNQIAVGLFVADMWANASANEEGSATQDSFQSLYDGYADTRSYVESGLADFVLVYAKGSRTDETLPFGEVTKWWGGIAEASGIPLYVMQDNAKLYTNAPGWKSPDEVVKQLEEAKMLQAFSGNVLACYARLCDNPDGSSDYLVSHYQGTIKEGGTDGLVINSPTKTVFETEEPNVTFQGTFDPNFKVYFNDQPIELNEAGTFYYLEDLKVGVNTFTIRHKADVTTYKITRRVQVLKSVAPAGTLEVDGGMSISLSAIAYKGSKVTATINGKVITLKEQEGQIEEIGPNSNYAQFVGSYTVPKGIINKAQNLGTVVFNGQYDIFPETAPGASVTVRALPAVIDQEYGGMVEITAEMASVFDANTTSTRAAPSFGQLPRGTIDYFVRKVTYQSSDASIDYYIMKSGRRVRASDARLIESVYFTENPLQFVESSSSGGDTFVKVHAPYKMAFNVVPAPVGFAADYAVSSFNASQVVITFDYATGVSGGTPDMSGSSIFSSAQWTDTVVGNVSKPQLVLNLRKAGNYNGVSMYYDDGGNLVFRFSRIPQSLSGLNVVIDPGHGWTSSAKSDPGAIGFIVERDANLALAKLVTAKLQALGANVTRLQTESSVFVTSQRATIARQYNPDIFISIHCNSAPWSPTVRGTEVYYHLPQSQPLARSISSRLGAQWGAYYGDGRNYNRGDKFGAFLVTMQNDYASVLIETGFVSNYEEAMALANATQQDALASAIVQGIADYVAGNN